MVRGVRRAGRRCPPRSATAYYAHTPTLRTRPTAKSDSHTAHLRRPHRRHRRQTGQAQFFFFFFFTNRLIYTKKKTMAIRERKTLPERAKTVGTKFTVFAHQQIFFPSRCGSDAETGKKCKLNHRRRKGHADSRISLSNGPVAVRTHERAAAGGVVGSEEKKNHSRSSSGNGSALVCVSRQINGATCGWRLAECE